MTGYGPSLMTYSFIFMTFLCIQHIVDESVAHPLSDRKAWIDMGTAVFATTVYSLCMDCAHALRLFL